MHIVRRSEEWQVSWTAVSYRWLTVLSTVLLLVLMLVIYVIFGARIFAFLEGFRNSAPNSSVAQPLTASSPLTLDELEGEVRILRARSPSWTLAHKGDVLSPGDVLQTNDTSAATVAIVGVIRLDIAPASVVVLAHSNSTQDGFKVGLRLTSGRLEFTSDQVRPGSEPELLLADATFVPAEKTSGRVWAAANSGSYSLVLLQGSGTLERGARGFDLRPFKRATLLAGEKDFLFKDEPPPPPLLAPESNARLVVSSCSTPVEFAWEPLDAGVSYFFRIAPNRFLTAPVAEKIVSSPALQLPLAEGEYFWQVEGVRGRQRVSLASSVGRFYRVCGQTGAAQSRVAEVP
jgi:hypothetical protein